MARKDRRNQVRAARRPRRRGPSAAERAAERATERANGAGPDGGGASGDGGNGRGPALALVQGGGDQPPPDATRPKLKKLRTALVLIGLSLLALVSWVFGIMMAVAQDLPRLENRAQFERAENSVILDVDGERIATLTNNEGRILIASDEIAPVMKEAVVAVEDQRFYDHRGVDFQGIARALYQDVLAGSAQQGASTITQQFVKNALEAQNSRTIFQKLREAALAYQLERQWSKDKIITEYLNSIYFGEGAYGIEAAAETFFGYAHPGCGEEGQLTCASQLLPYEAALLAGIIASPEAYSPRTNPDAALERRNLVLQNMLEQGYITQEEYGQYVAQPLPPESDINPPTDDSQAPYFTSWLRQQLVDRYGAGEAFGGGLEITSTLDLDLQAQVEEIAASRAAGVGLDTAIVVMDNETAGVRAMVGGYDFSKQPFNLATNGLRQPGSAFKPFTLAAALEAGHTTSEVYSSSPQKIPFKVRVERKDGGTKVVNDLFEVDNYDDNYLGSASLATATTYSDNAVYTQLGMQVGIDKIVETAREMGINTSLRTEDARYSVNGGPFKPYNPATILGGLAQGVTPLEMTHAYLTLEEGGDRITGTMAAHKGGPLGIIKVQSDPDDDGDAELVEDRTGANGENESQREQALAPETAETATTTLSTVISSGTGQRAQTGEPTWGKTGTTDDNGDAWFCGATPDITACVWVGHADSNTPMTSEFGGAPVDGGTIPALIFADVVNAYLGLAEDDPANADSTESAVPDPAAAPEAAPVAPAPAPEEIAPAPAPEETAPAPEEQAVPEDAAPPAEGGGAVVGRVRD